MTVIAVVVFVLVTLAVLPLFRQLAANKLLKVAPERSNRRIATNRGLLQPAEVVRIDA